MIRKYFRYIFFLAMLSGCISGPHDEKSLPPGTGKPGEVLLVIDSAKWNGDIGHELKVTFNSSVESLPRSQPMFDLRHVGPRDFKSILLQAKNLVLLIPLYEDSRPSQRMQNFFNEKSLDSLRANPDLFLIQKKNLYATNQVILFIIGHSKEDLLRNLVNYRDAMRKFFNDAENKRALTNLYGIKEESMIANKLKDEHNFDIRVPYSFKVVYDKDNFIWLRLPGQKIDKNIVIAYKDYKDPKDFESQNLIDWRNKIFNENIFGDPDNPESYVITESLVPPIISQVTFNGKFAMKINGLWKTHDISMGGPFVAYSLVDQKLNRMYYIEGFVYSPGVQQRELIREMDVVLQTFHTSDSN